MPFIRVIRDKRGYETTYLMHWYREAERQRSRVLFVFRTPAGMPVGRGALEPDVIREIEANHPDIAFDWDAVRGSQQIVEVSPEPRRRRSKPEEPEAPPPVPGHHSEVTSVDPAPVIPAAIEGATPEAQVAFLAQWYPVIRERLARRHTDPERRDALLVLAERLNPAGWTESERIEDRLVEAAEGLERISRVLARRRRSRRRANDAASPETGTA